MLYCQVRPVGFCNVDLCHLFCPFDLFQIFASRWHQAVELLAATRLVRNRHFDQTGTEMVFMF